MRTTNRGTAKLDSTDAWRVLQKHIDHGEAGGVVRADGDAGDWLTPQAEDLYGDAGFEAVATCPVCLRSFESWRPEEEGGVRIAGEARLFCSPRCRSRLGDATRRDRPTTWNRCVVCSTGFVHFGGKVAARRDICPPPWSPESPTADYRRSPCWVAYAARVRANKAQAHAILRAGREARGRLALRVRALMLGGERPGDLTFEAVAPALAEAEAWRLVALIVEWEAHLDICDRCQAERFRLAHRWATAIRRVAAGEIAEAPTAIRRSRAQILAAQATKRQAGIDRKERNRAANARRGVALRQAAIHRETRR